jgi:UDP-N-acetylglucosamine--N-acetylmuramyl-(pentapeptide) pyrophosphoryl-undecaprenol N-acetylglucosamine transferase
MLTVAAGNPSAGGWAGRVGATFRLAAGTFEARGALAKLAPGLVVGFGGYPSMPTVSAALSLRLPVLLHEQNAVLGRANRVFAGRAAVLAASFGGAALESWPRTARLRAVVTGNPVRPAIAGRARAPYVAPAEDGEIRLLVFGGSQGARILSEVVPSALSALPRATQNRLRVVQQCRREDLDRAERIYRDAGIAARLTTFIGDMPEQLTAAHLVISRAGASTIGELTTVGRPAILAPYPHATDDHQSANARAVADAGGAWVMPDSELTPPALAKQLQRLLASPDRLSAAAAAAAGLGRPNAVEALADAVEVLAPSSPTGVPVSPSSDFTARALFRKSSEAA